VTDSGQYRFKRMPFGLRNASSHFQFVMNQAMLPFIQNVIVYIDDIVIFSDSVSDLVAITEKVFRHLLRLGFRLAPHKLRVSDEIEFLGLLVSSEGLRISPARYERIKNLPIPRTLTQLRSFLGFCNWFREFIPNFSSLSAPCTDLLKRRQQRFSMTPTAEAAVCELCAALQKAPPLHHFDPERPTAVFTDASDAGIGAVLMQASEDAKWVFPIGYFSRKFTDSQRNWTTIQRECFAIFASVKHWSHLLAHRRFKVFTDHRNLQWLSSAQNPMLVRWYALLLEFDFEIIHISGPRNAAADFLSRTHGESTPLLILGDSSPTTNDGQIDSPPVQKERVPWNPDQLRILLDNHNVIVGHSGVSQLVSTTKLPRSMVEKFVKSCPICQKQRITEIQKPISSPHFGFKAVDPLEAILMDHITGLPRDKKGNQNILSIMLPSIRFVFLFATKTVDADEVFVSLLNVMSLIGSPRFFRSDQGSAFDSELVKSLAFASGAISIMNDAYVHEQAGMIERSHRQTLRHLRGLIFEMDITDDWGAYLPLVQRIQNLTPHRDLQGYSPAALLFGYMSPSTHRLLAPALPDDFPATRIRRMTEIQENAIRKSLELQARPNEPPPPQHFRKGQFVLFKDEGRPRTSKTLMPWKGPYKVQAYDKELGVYTLHSPAGSSSSDTIKVHVSKLKKYNMEQTENPVATHARDFGHRVITKIKSHRGSPKRKMAMTFVVVYDDGFEGTLKYADVRNTEALDNYVKDKVEQNPDLVKLLDEPPQKKG